MNEEITTILSEILEDNKELKKDQKIILTVFETYVDDLKELNERMSKIKIEQPEIDFNPLISGINNGLNTILNLLRDHQEKLITENIDLKQEKEKKRFFRIKYDKFVGYLSLITLVIFIAFFVTIRKYKKAKLFKNSYEYVYYKQTDDSREYLDYIMYKFQNDTLKSDMLEELKIMKKSEVAE